NAAPAKSATPRTPVTTRPLVAATLRLSAIVVLALDGRARHQRRPLIVACRFGCRCRGVCSGRNSFGLVAGFGLRCKLELDRLLRLGICFQLGPFGPRQAGSWLMSPTADHAWPALRCPT